MNRYDEAIRILRVMRDDAQREATNWGYHANNKYIKGSAPYNKCRDEEAIWLYIRDVLNAGIEFTRQRRDRIKHGLKVSDRMTIVGIRIPEENGAEELWKTIKAASGVKEYAGER